jgi:motility quorum-sensing regulator/GCU-specific mRNA interferase toxin
MAGKMEKYKPHCSIKKMLELLECDDIEFTFSALSGAAELAIDHDNMEAIIKSLTGADFYKSMTAINDHTVWHDVYKPRTTFGELYIKIIVSTTVLVVSFKRS